MTFIEARLHLHLFELEDAIRFTSTYEHLQFATLGAVGACRDREGYGGLPQGSLCF